ncbi:MAG: ABC transporter ATP-binding protein [Chlorobiales bacterium]|nr:ABC transporter ATP-binding protein [Chlorobiales bacterium]
MQKNQRTETEMLRFEDVSCGYKGYEPILSGVSFIVKAGERVALLGMNGSGKTTLLKHIAGLKKPLTGKIKLNGIDIATKTPDALFGDVGFVFQNPDYQIFDTTVERECGFCLRNRKYEAGEIGRRVQKWLDLFGISGMKERSPLTLSFGEKRRLTLASVLVAEPELILLDEPTTALDEANIAALRQTLLDLSLYHGKTLCITTHDLDFALDIATRILIIGDGKLMADISTADLTFDLLEQCGIPAPFPGSLAQKTGISERPAGHWHILKSITDEIAGNH